MPLLDLYSLWVGSAASTAAAVVAQLQVLYQADILVDGVAASTEFCRVNLSMLQGTKEATQHGDVARWFKPELYAIHAEGDFYYQAGANLAGSKFEGATIGPSTGTVAPLVLSMASDLAVGDLVNIWQGVASRLDVGADEGEILKGSISTEGAYRVVQARRLLRAQQSASSGTGTAVQLGAVSSAQALYAALHVVGTTGTPSGTVFSIVSAPSSTLAGSTTRATFAAGTSARVGEWKEAAGAITDTWFAASWAGFAGTAFTASISAGVE